MSTLSAATNSIESPRSLALPRAFGRSETRGRESDNPLASLVAKTFAAPLAAGTLTFAKIDTDDDWGKLGEFQPLR